MKTIVIEQRRYKGLTQMCAFGEANRNRFAADSPAAVALPELVTSVAEVGVLVVRLASAKNRARELEFETRQARNAVTRRLQSLYYTAQAISTEVPGFDSKFQAPLNSASRLLTAGLSAVNDAAPHKELFIKYAMPEDFLEVLESHVRSFQRLLDERKQAGAVRGVDEKEIHATYGKALTVATRFDAIMRNTFKDDPVMLERWIAACYVPMKTRAKTAQTKTDPPSAGESQDKQPETTAPPAAAQTV
jgi:hypothetical protein